MAAADPDLEPLKEHYENKSASGGRHRARTNNRAEFKRVHNFSEVACRVAAFSRALSVSSFSKLIAFSVRSSSGMSGRLLRVSAPVWRCLIGGHRLIDDPNPAVVGGLPCASRARFDDSIVQVDRPPPLVWHILLDDCISFPAVQRKFLMAEGTVRCMDIGLRCPPAHPPGLSEAPIVEAIFSQPARQNLLSADGSGPQTAA
jgi:hypothetical protein